MESNEVIIDNSQAAFGRAYETTEAFASEIGLDGKNALHLRLLAEEVLGLSRQIVRTEPLTYRLDGDVAECHLYLQAKKDLNPSEMQELLSASTTGKNVAYQGFMGKIRSLFLSPEELSSPWTLTDFKRQLQDHTRKSPFEHLNPDDLERSIVACLADEVTVSMSDNNILMVITKRFS